MTISKEILDELLQGVERPEDLLGDAGLMKELKIKLMERMLGAELSDCLGPLQFLSKQAGTNGVASLWKLWKLKLQQTYKLWPKFSNTMKR